MSAEPSFFSDVLADTLSRGESVRLRVQGVSMLPWLRDGDAVRIRPAAGRRIARGDIALFLRAPDRPILHRVVRVGRQDGQTVLECLGDSEHGEPERVPASAVLGVVDLSSWARAGYLAVNPARRFLNRWLSRKGIRLRHG